VTPRPARRAPAASERVEEALVLTLPMPENGANRRGHGHSRHWRVQHAEKLALWARCDLLRAAKLIPPPPPAPIARATVRSTMYLGAAMDDDNAMHRHKPLLDWLKRNGYIVDDKRKCIRWEGLPEQVVKRTHEYRIVLTLTPQP
jgi:hypothetical protein